MTIGAVWIATGMIIIGLVAYILGLGRKVGKRRASRAQHNTTSVRMYDDDYNVLWAGSDFPSVAVVERNGQRSVWKLDWEYVSPSTRRSAPEDTEVLDHVLEQVTEFLGAKKPPPASTETEEA